MKAEICNSCTHRHDCRRRGYLAHTEDAQDGRVVVTTVARLTTISDAMWQRIGGVICDEDVLPGLFQRFTVLASDLRRAIKYTDRRRAREEAKGRGRHLPFTRRVESLLAIQPLLQAILCILRSPRRKPAHFSTTCRSPASRS